MARRKQPEYKIVWTAPPDPVKILKAFGEIYARQVGMELEGVYNEKGEKLA